jgi:hypothetical protein
VGDVVQVRIRQVVCFCPAAASIGTRGYSTPNPHLCFSVTCFLSRYISLLTNFSETTGICQHKSKETLTSSRSNVCHDAPLPRSYGYEDHGGHQH